MKSWILLFFSIVAEVVATSALKSSDGFSRLIPSVLSIAGYGIAFYLLSHTLKVLPMGITYAAWSGLGIVFIAIAGRMLYGQQLDVWAVTGMAMIVGGVLVMSFLSKAGAH